VVSNGELRTPVDEVAGEALLRVEGLTKVFRPNGLLARSPTGPPAVDDVSFAIARGETFGLVGESGCGKSTIARCIVRVAEPTAGRVVFDGKDIVQLGRAELQRMRRRVQIVFQDSGGALNPRMSVRSLVEEPLIIHGIGERGVRRERALEILELVGISRGQADRKPYALSGGQRQRLGLARALILRPELLLLDEPISAVDVSVQAQVLNLLRDLQQSFDLTYVFIVHDLTIAEYFCDHVAVLYLGRIMELAPSQILFQRPLHPYTVGLLSAVPLPDPKRVRERQRILIRGEAEHAPSDLATTGCPFQPRCPVGRTRSVCSSATPPLERREAGHWIACHFPGEMPVAHPVRADPDAVGLRR
jgi:oligopeptide/dipeptide ABC transporter ATP-binding protein